MPSACGWSHEPTIERRMALLMIDLVESIKLVGGIAGLGTAAFTIFDRMVKYRPIVSLTAAAHPYDDQGVPYLKLTNRSDREIVVDSVEVPEGTALHFHDDLMSIIERQLGVTHARLLAPGETAYFEIYLDAEFREALDTSSQTLEFKVFWHQASGPTWLRGLRLRASIRGNELSLVLKDAARRKIPVPGKLTALPTA